MNKEQINSDKKVLASLEAEYKRVRCKADSVRAYVTDLNFEDNVPDKQERYLMTDQLHVYEQVQSNLINRIRFYRARIRRTNKIKDWFEFRPTDSAHIGVDVSSDNTHHCGQDAHTSGELGTEGNPIPLPSPVDDGSAAVEDDLPESLKKLVGMQVVSVGDMPCDGCPVDHYGAPCVKVELVGGILLCLSPLPNSIITE